MNTDLLIRASEGDLFVGESRVLLRNIVTPRARVRRLNKYRPTSQAYSGASPRRNRVLP